MKCIQVTLLASMLLAAAPAFAQTSVAGDWEVTVDSPAGANTFQVTFKQDGEKVSGILKSQMGELPFEGGTITGSDLKFGFSIPVQGMSLDITMTGKVNGAAMAGKAKLGDFGDADWTAKRAGTTSTSETTSKTTTTTTTTTTTLTGGLNGKWDLTLQTPGGDFPATATITDDSGKLTGTFGSQMGEVPMTGTIDGKSIKMQITAQTPNGGMQVTMTGDLDGDAIVNGSAEIAGLGQVTWSAKRAKQ